MDDILYIVLGIAWLAFTVYTNKQKADKKRAGQMQRPPEQVDSPSEEANHPAPARNIFEEIFNEQLPAIPEAEPEIYIPEVVEPAYGAKTVKYQENEAESLEEIKPEVSLSYFEDHYKSGYKNEESHRVLPNIQREEDDELKTELIEEFDLRKAILFSEILRAPYV